MEINWWAILLVLAMVLTAVNIAWYNAHQTIKIIEVEKPQIPEINCSYSENGIICLLPDRKVLNIEKIYNITISK